MKRLFLLFFCLCFANTAAAVTVQYDISFTSASGEDVGFGSFSYDPAAREPLYVRTLADPNTGAYPGLLCNGHEEGCKYSTSWTPITTLDLNLAGRSIDFLGPNWLEGSYIFCGKGQIANFYSREWVGGNCTGESYFTMDVPQLHVEHYVGEFYYLELIESGSAPLEIAGTVTFTRVATVPLPASGSLMLAGLSVFGWYRRRHRLGNLT